MGDELAKQVADAIRIVGVDRAGVGRPRNDGTRGSALYRVPLKLSRTPSSTWAQLFVATWDNPPQYTTRHRPGIASVVGDTVVLDGTTIEEVEQVHLETLRHVFAAIDARTSEIEERARTVRKAAEQEAQAHEENVDAVVRRMKFD